MRNQSENFSVSFNGQAFENHEISAYALGQSLLAVDSLAKTCGHAAYGRDADVTVKVQGSPRPGSFIVDLIVVHPLESTAAGAVAILKEIITISKWAYGKAVKFISEDGDKARVENAAGEIGEFEKEALRVYAMSKTRIDLSRLTQTLDNEGAESIAFSGGAGGPEIITRSDRGFYREEDGLVLTDNESELALEVLTPRLRGDADGWTFSEGEDGQEFKARVEDEEFLRRVREGEYSFKSGTSILAMVRTVQIRKNRTLTRRSVIEVSAVINP